MIKKVILLIHIISVFLYQLVFNEEITISQQISQQIQQEIGAVVEIKINKNDITGFAKIQQELADGFRVKPIDTKGATFSYKDNKIKLIWMALPLEKEFTIKYEIIPNKQTLGKFKIGGKFSFISESERQNITVPTKEFEVVEELIVAQQIEEEIATDTSKEKLQEEAIIKLITVSVKREVEHLGKGKFEITLEIDKTGVKEFAKLREKIPVGFIASENESKGGVFSIQENEIKILWLTVPEEDKYTVTYNIEALPETPIGKYNIAGHYSYLKDEVTSKYDIDGTFFQLTEKPIEEEEVDSESIAETKEEVKVPETIAEEEKEEELAEVETPAPVAVVEAEEEPKAEETANITSTPSPEADVAYKVQVAAGHKKVSSTYFKNKFKLKQEVSTETHEGWIKYLVGSFDEYKKARDQRNKIRNNINTAFVTAYNYGKRITVQEALMISNQKWYK